MARMKNTEAKPEEDQELQVFHADLFKQITRHAKE